MAQWAEAVVRRSTSGEEKKGPTWQTQKEKGGVDDQLNNTHNFQGLMSAKQYKRKREVVMDDAACTDEEVSLST